MRHKAEHVCTSLDISARKLHECGSKLAQTDVPNLDVSTINSSDLHLYKLTVDLVAVGAREDHVARYVEHVLRVLSAGG